MKLHQPVPPSSLFTSLLLFPVLAATLSGSPLAQNPPITAPTTTITIDGSKEPDRIPEWILWREVFRTVALVSEKSKDHGDGILSKHLGMGQKEKDKFVARCLMLQDDEAGFDKKAQTIVDASPKNLSEETKKKLKDLHEDKKNKILDHRDKLKNEIGDQLYNRLKSWARLHVAPGIKVGNLTSTPANPAPLQPDLAGKGRR